ncbi:hypothetical protein GYMLUDRAFT_248245 [Collybiopsis luxurians FD-317 M1]|uniref:Uncharacterized protein n=1 Tax=Collybiopsis luxurians FD-317 M1 TaxID=944289 RepID=A0A0D0C123_9AGAR|nr:hypothetical protein GYMLUDRAFT_248245 [Collybiopsis luxurians FD-317 M1]
MSLSYLISALYRDICCHLKRRSSPALPDFPFDFPSDSDPKIMATYGTLPFVFEKNEVEVRDGENRIWILKSQTASNGIFDLSDDSVRLS